MKTKLFLATFLAMFMIGATFAQALNQGVQKNNATSNAPNFYEKLYGTTNGASRGALDAVVYIDYALENDFVVAALVAQGFNVTVASSWTDFDAKLLSGNYGFAVGFNQDWYLLPSAAAIQTFISAGGCMIYCDWTYNNTLADFFEASYTANNNQTVVTITDPVLASGLTNPFTLGNPGWRIFSTGLNAIGSGEVLATFGNGNAAIVRGNDKHTIILGYLSDTPPVAMRRQLFENVLNFIVCGPNTFVPVPVSNWAIFIGLFLIVTFAVIRFRKLV